MRSVIAVAALGALAAAGCGSPPAGAVTSCQVTTVLPAPVETDILFVVDDSGSMAAEQQNLATSFDAFITRLAASPVKNEFQIGVTTTSVDWPFTAQNAAGYTVQTTYDGVKPYPKGALVAAAGHPRLLLASSPTLVQDFKANVNVGTNGAGKEQGLRAALLAVTDRIGDGANAGFLRPGARLAVIVVSDEDDCSDPATPPAIIYVPNGPDRCHSDAEQALLPPVASYVTALRGPLAGQARDVLVAVIAAVDPLTKQPAPPACNPNGYQAKRYRAFVDAFGQQGLIDDVCQADFSATLRAIAGLIDPGQTIELAETPADPKLLTVSVAHAAGGTTSCPLLPAGSGASATGVVYVAPQPGHAAKLVFQGGCTLAQGDQVHVQVLCAG